MKILIFALLLGGYYVHAATQHYSTRLLSSFEAESPPSRGESEEVAVQKFLDEHYGEYRPDFEWKKDRRFRDKTHAHYTFKLYYKGYRVLDHSLHLDYNRKGFVEYAVSSWRRSFDIRLTALGEQSQFMIENQLKAPYFAAHGYFEGKVKSEPAIFVDDDTDEATPAFLVRFFPKKGIQQWRHFVAEANSGRVLAERPIRRNVTVNSKVWKISPYDNGSNDGDPETLPLEGLDASNTLVNGFFKVRRMENTTTPALSHISPDLTTAINFSHDPENYDYTCTGSITDCPNQRIDGTNVYYHLYKYREKLQTYFTILEIDSPMVTPPAGGDSREPLEVYINAFGLDTTGDGDFTDEANNAAFFPYGCGEVAGVEIERCLIFLRPKPVTSAECGSNVSFYDLAREAMVIVHEYQHFVTDAIVDLVPGAFDEAQNRIVRNVGDALHEGYSDYFGASIVTEDAGTDVTKIGEYGFQQCTFYLRDVGTLRPYTNGEADQDAHVAGLTWASGLWQLRKELGQTTADLIALKSIFFLGTRVGFAESVEALVKADKAINDGANVGRIRTLFYNDLHWVGGEGDVFRDPSTGVAEVGFRSCNSVVMSKTSVSSTLGILSVWLGMLLGIGRLRRRE